MKKYLHNKLEDHTGYPYGYPQFGFKKGLDNGNKIKNK